MARIKTLPSLEIIKGLKGVLDFVSWRGIYYVRTWPRRSLAPPAPAEEAAASLFGQVVSAYSLLDPSVLAELKIEAQGQTLTARDIHVKAVYGYLHERL